MRKYRTKLLLKELFRKTIHICSALVPTLLGIIYVPTILLLVLAAVLYIIFETARVRGKKIPLVSKITEIAARKRDEDKFVLGPVTLVVGILIAAIFLPPKAARLGIYALSFGDGTASLFGKMFGRIRIPGTKGKTAAGSLACFTAVFLSSFAVTGNTFQSLILAFTAMIIEIVPLSDFDNLIIPVTIGIVSLVV